MRLWGCRCPCWAFSQTDDCLQHLSSKNENTINQYPTAAVWTGFCQVRMLYNSQWLLLSAQSVAWCLYRVLIFPQSAYILKLLMCSVFLPVPYNVPLPHVCNYIFKYCNPMYVLYYWASCISLFIEVNRFLYLSS